jgi:hypothetical protein
MEDSQRDRYGKAVREGWPDLFRTREKEEWTQMLVALADQNIERLNAKRTDAIDPDGVEQHGHLMGGTGEIDENAPNEANCDETMSIVEAQATDQFTANSGDPSGLDNGAARSAEECTPEQGKAPGSATISGNPKPH